MVAWAWEMNQAAWAVAAVAVESAAASAVEVTWAMQAGAIASIRDAAGARSHSSTERLIEWLERLRPNG